MSWNAGPLDAAIRAAGIPIIGVSANSKTGEVRIDFDPSATDIQQAQAQSIASAWDWSDAAQQSRDDAGHPERTALRQAAAAAITANNSYLAIPAPTAAQVRDQVAALTQQTNRIIRRLVQLD